MTLKLESYKEGQNKAKITHRSLQTPMSTPTRTSRWRAGTAAAPLTPWIGSSPRAAGKSPVNGPRGPTPDAVVFIAKLQAFFFVMNICNQIGRLRSERGNANSADLLTSELEDDERVTKKLRRTPSPEGERAATKLHTSRISASRTPPAGTKLTPTLYTGIDPWIPQPPATGAAAGGGGIHGSSEHRWRNSVGARSEERRVGTECLL